ncbi:MAG: EAL domain-containing protein, partial [Gammaproteobacteria bacterium]|nr:EAL domain-containing protein [Gammaproteobacteria bacterium]
IETTAIHADGYEFPIELAINRIDVDDEIYFTAYLRNLTEAYELKAKLTYQASHDSLTGLINRREFEERFISILDASGRSEKYCLLYLDLDQFKVINDSYGHMAGDELLRQLSQELNDSISDDDLFARLGGDEFAILLNIDSLSSAEEIALKLIDGIRQFRFYWGDDVFNIAVSIGLVYVEDCEESYAELMSAADSACYKAKEEGGSRYYIYRPDDADMKERRGQMGMVNKIQRSLENNNFKLYKQKIIPLKGSCTQLHCEILLRMVNDENEIILPEQFIPAAENYNLMLSIDEWVVDNTFKWLSSLSCPEEIVGLCSINLSGFSITDPQFISYVLEQKKKYRIPGKVVCFEITETVAIKNLAMARQFMRDLKKEGFMFALDDFGSGLSSFGYLNALPVDFIKIDGIFVKDISTNPVNRAIVKSISEIGNVMSKKTIAEYVESAGIAEILKDLGVDYAQGYYFSQPEPVLDDDVNIDSVEKRF